MDENKEMEVESNSGKCFSEQELFDRRAAFFS